jgi:hypothetical protein
MSDPDANVSFMLKLVTAVTFTKHFVGTSGVPVLCDAGHGAL